MVDLLFLEVGIILSEFGNEKLDNKFEKLRVINNLYLLLPLAQTINLLFLGV
jgi:hypothetical protein